jgi:SAM-dependent methyltransferase
MSDVVRARRMRILEDLAPGNVFQPATVLWRVYEIDAVRQHATLGGRVLDLGCGDGTLACVVFEGAEAHVVGVEPEPADAALAERSAVYDRVHNAPGNAIPEPDASFDCVFSNSVLEHIEDLEPVLTEVARVLGHGGSFVFTVPSANFHACLDARGPFSWFSHARGETAHQAIDRRLMHYRYWSVEQWRAALARHGMKLEKTAFYLPCSAVRAWERLSNWTGGVLFELFGRRAGTRSLKRKLGLGALERLVPKGAQRAAVARLLERAIARPDRDVESYGGLLVIARREAAT